MSLVDSQAEFHKESIANQKYLEKILPGIDVVFHLAALKVCLQPNMRESIYLQMSRENQQRKR